MANNLYNYSQTQFPSQLQFLQPQGSLYLINSSAEFANIPAGLGVSAGLCMSENLLYLKTLQNGQPACLVFNLAQTKPESEPSVAEELKKLSARLEVLEQKKGGLLNV